MEMPAHIHGWRNARRTTLTISVGRKLLASPALFIARETQSSPPVPAITITVNRAKSRNLNLPRSFLRGRARSGMAYDKNTQTDDCDPKPSQGGNGLTQNQITK